jgi:hypothetical protein
MDGQEACQCFEFVANQGMQCFSNKSLWREYNSSFIALYNKAMGEPIPLINTFRITGLI